ncbi:MAG TPA: hypothetical protein VFX59_30420 [Polyangiales bacterium]|nr:hypothetical protein [Polyangiales bacterium]
MDPTRLRNDADGSELVLLETLRADAPPDDVRASMWKVVAAQAAVAGVASSAGAAVPVKMATALLPKALAAKVAVVLAVGAVGAGAALLQPSKVPERAQVHAPVKVEAAAPRRLESEQTCVEGVAPGCGEVNVPSAPTAVPEVRAPKRVKRVREKADPIAAIEARPEPVRSLDTLQAESRMLAQARAQLRAHDLAGAEQTLNQARDQFARGALGQEREVLQVELLSALGDREGADHRARRFLRKHSDSPHAKRVQRFLIAP